MRVLAVDPDLHSLGWCLLRGGDADGGTEVELCGCVQIPKDYHVEEAVTEMTKASLSLLPHLSKADLVIVEGQQVYLQGGRRAHPQDLINLAQVAGAIVGLASAAEIETSIVTPQKWKSNIPKEISQGRAWQRLGVHYKLTITAHQKWTVPLDPIKTDGSMRLQSSWKHTGDAVAMALWGLEKWKRPDPPDTLRILRRLKRREPPTSALKGP